MTSAPILICTDLDRTLLPNGPLPESPEARTVFQQLVEHPAVRLAYVSGRDKQLIIAAIEEYDLPMPDYAIGDVGTTIYEIKSGDWQQWTSWEEEIALDWQGKQWQALDQLLADIQELQLQEETKQNHFKLSYYAPADCDALALQNRVKGRLEQAGLKTNLIWSIDEQTNMGLLDVLPANADKNHAIHFLIQHTNIPIRQVMFAGDSGNDIPVLTSSLQAVLVNNAIDEVRQAALVQAKANQTEAQLYLAKGGLMGMNGNYAAGILEGVAHYFPDSISLINN